MGTLTFLELKNEIKSFHGDRGDFDTRLNAIINLSQMRIARLSIFEELNANVIGGDLTKTADIAADKVYTLPTNLRSIYAIKVYLASGDRYKKLVGKDSKSFDEMFVRPEEISRNMPTFYHRWGSVIEMFPVIEQDYKIDVRFSKWPAVLSADGDFSDFDQKDDAIITLSASWMFMTLKKKEDANFLWTVYRNMMKDILGEDRESKDIKYGLTGLVDAPIGNGYDEPFVRSTV